MDCLDPLSSSFSFCLSHSKVHVHTYSHTLYLSNPKLAGATELTLTEHTFLLINQVKKLWWPFKCVYLSLCERMFMTVAASRETDSSQLLLVKMHPNVLLPLPYTPVWGIEKENTILSYHPVKPTHQHSHRPGRPHREQCEVSGVIVFHSPLFLFTQHSNGSYRYHSLLLAFLRLFLITSSLHSSRKHRHTRGYTISHCSVSDLRDMDNSTTD